MSKIIFILEMTREFNTQTVKNVLDLLADKYAKTTTERCLDLVKELFEFEMLEGESYEVYLQRFQKMMGSCDKENIRTQFYFIMCHRMIESCTRKDRLTPEEKLRLEEQLVRPGNNNDVVPKDDDEVFDVLKKEFKRLKIINNIVSNIIKTFITILICF